MTVNDRLDPALRPFAAARTNLSPELIGPTRASLNARRAEQAAGLPTAGVAIAATEVPGAGPAIPVRIYRGGPPAAPAVVYCHAGAFVLGNLDTDHRQCVEFARRARCTVISVDYRLAPEHPYPAALDDVSAVLAWAAERADELDIDATRLAVAGSSAGGGLAALLAQRAACGSLPPVVFTLLHQPVLDDRPTPSKLAFGTTPGFDGAAAAAMWQHYLADVPPTPGAVPARQTDLTGLAATMITCSELDPLRDEALAYALRLLAVAVPTELHVAPGTCHGYDSLLPDWEVSQQLFALQGAALHRAFWPA
ncbi:alpha/beta hydrolase [soil metagenome]